MYDGKKSQKFPPMESKEPWRGHGEKIGGRLHLWNDLLTSGKGYAKAKAEKVIRGNEIVTLRDETVTQGDEMTQE